MNDLELALHLAAVASEIALGWFGRVAAKLKPDGTPVTEADIAIERRLRELLATERPLDAILGEELGASGSSSRRWLLDPIDGTSELVSGRSEWGTHVALEQDGQLTLGVITRPLLEATWWASRGGGAYRRKPGAAPAAERLRVSQRNPLAASRVTAWAPEQSSVVAYLKENATWVTPDLSAILRLAEGELDAVIDPSGKAWDHAPAVVIVEEAGGRFSDACGGCSVYVGEGRFSNGLIHAELEALLGHNNPEHGK